MMTDDKKPVSPVGEHTMPISREDIKEKMRATIPAAGVPVEQNRKSASSDEQYVRDTSENAGPAKKKFRLPLWARILLKTIRILIVPALCIGALITGMYIGYSIVGEQDSSDVWKIETWRHVYDLVFGN